MTWADGKRVEPTGRAGAAGGGKGAAPITLATYDNRPEFSEVAQVLKQQLEKAGFEVELEVREYSQLEADALDGEFDAFVLARNAMLDTGDPVAVLAADYTCDGANNIAQLCDKDVDRAVAAAERTADPDKRQDAAMKAEAAVGWTALAAHTSALLRQERATQNLAATRSLGAGHWHLLRRSMLPAVLPPVTRHALLRLPGIALALASLGFLGLGAQPPSPEWGLCSSPRTSPTPNAHPGPSSPRPPPSPCSAPSR
ncbi:hypothetical protein GCM10027073_47630 [Streptomyces chlorus]